MKSLLVDTDLVPQAGLSVWRILRTTESVYTLRLDYCGTLQVQCTVVLLHVSYFTDLWMEGFGKITVAN